MQTKPRTAVIGSGIAGLACAWLLRDTHDVTLFEADARLGGHAHTVDVDLDGVRHPVDTGFLVFNDRTYPNLVGLFAHLGVQTVPTEMTFSVSLQQPALEWAGSNLFTVFGQAGNLVRRRFWSMLADILRFNREATAWLAQPTQADLSLRQYLQDGRYSTAFSDWYLLPMAAAIWSCPPAQMLDMPLATFVRFCHNHGLLQILDRPAWRTVAGGSRQYVQRLAADLADVRTRCPVYTVARYDQRPMLVHAQGVDSFDQVVLACHSDQALSLLGATATPAQREVLSAVSYQPNRAVLHTDANLLPRRRRLWSAWNYLAGNGAVGQQPVSVSYLLNRLQPLPFKQPVVVSLNPTTEPAPRSVLAAFEYAHPVFDAAAIAAQARLPEVQGQGGIWLAGAWCGYGFHEDGLRSALAVANALGAQAPWQSGAATVPKPAHTQSNIQAMYA